MTPDFNKYHGFHKRGAILLSYCLFLSSFYVSKMHSQDIPDSYAKEMETLMEGLYHHAYVQEDSTYFYLDKILDLATSYKDAEKMAEALINSSRLGMEYYDLGRVGKSVKALDSLLNTNKLFSTLTKENIIYRNSLTFDQGNYQYYLGNYNLARGHFENVVQTVKQLPDSLRSAEQIDLLTTAYSYIAKMYSDEGKYDTAKEFYERNNRIIQQEKFGDKEALSDNYSLLGLVYKKEGDFVVSNDYFLKTLKFYQSQKEAAKSLVSAAQHLAENHIQLSQLDSAGHYLEVIRHNLPQGHPFWNRYHKAQGELYKMKKEYAPAIAEFNVALKVTQDNWGNVEHEEVAHRYTDIGRLHADFGFPKKAIENYDFALNQLSGEYSNKTTRVGILKNKSLALNAMANTDANLSTIRTVDEAVSLLDSLKPSFSSHTDKLVLIEEAYPLFEAGLEASIKLYAETRDKAYIDHAFYYMEKGKGVLLLEALLSSNANKFGSIPYDLLEREKQLKAEITNIEKKIGRSKKETDELKDELFELNSEYRKLIDGLETNYQSYYDLKYNTNVITLDKLQDQLTNEEQVVSYFYGNKAIYALSITNESKKFYKIHLEESLENNFSKAIQLLADPKSDVVELAHITHNIFVSILEPGLAPNKNKLIIMPEGLLNYIPFGSLNTKSGSIRYLIDDMTISYANSATLLAQLNTKKRVESNVMAFAPDFDNSLFSELLPLPKNKDEARQTLQHFEGKAFLGKNANLAALSANISNYGIIHLATHAVIDDDTPENSFLACSPLPEQEYVLYLRDIYNLELHANLVTLSACESGLGNLRRGEGLISMARSFFYSGAASIASTLWKVNDASAATIMDYFYLYLAEGDEKDVALQKAKLTFLNSNEQNALKHPYYWSGFVISGNTQPLTSKTNMMWFAVGSLLIVGVGFFLYKKRRSA